MRAGAAIYVDECSARDTMTGAGIPRLLPTLKASPSVQQANPLSLFHVVLEGTRAAATDVAPAGAAMPAFGCKLSDEQVASVVTYPRNAWGNSAAAVTADTVQCDRKLLDRGKGGS
jgi:mono/diheme cytochrome c family protein